MFRKKSDVKMKGIFVVMDGLGDLPCKQFGGKTPLEAASTPSLDLLATRGKMGYMYTVRPGYTPGSDEAIVSMFGNDLNNSSRGRLEAQGAGIVCRKGDIAFRVNFGTIDSLEKKNVIDRRVGRTLTNKEALELSKAVNKIKFPYKFEFVSTVQHRAALVIRGDFSDKIAGDDITYQKGDGKEIEKIVPCKALVKGNKAKHTAEVLNEFLRLVYEVLVTHPVNLKRRKKGLLPANYLLIRAPGIDKPKLKQYKNWISTHSMPLEIGFSELSGIRNFGFKYPALKGIDAYKNLWTGLRKASRHSLEIVKKNLRKTNYVYIHFKETDLPGHDNKPIEKRNMIEYLDRNFFKNLVRIVSRYGIKVLVTGDHSTPCKLKAHSDDPVPVLLYMVGVPNGKKFFCEKEAKKGKLGRIVGKDLFGKTGFLK